MTHYQPREIARSLREALQKMPVVVLSGMRQTGKSMLLQSDPAFRGRCYISLDDPGFLMPLRDNPLSVLTADRLTIDETQKFPDLFPSVKRLVDQDRSNGRFLLSGSATPLHLKKTLESLAGMAVYFDLLPFTRREITGETGREPFILSFLKNGKIPNRQTSALRWDEIDTGGMPIPAIGKIKDPSVWFRGYYQSYLEKDIRNFSRLSDLAGFKNLLQLTALRSGNLLNMSDLARDSKLTLMSVSRYLNLMESSFLIRRLPAYLKNKTSRLIKSPKIYLTDSGLLSHMVEASGLRTDDPLRGHIAESYVLQNLSGILSAHNPQARIHFWNIQGRCEVDFVISTPGKTMAIEVKYAERWSSHDLEGLIRYRDSSPDCAGCFIAYNGKETIRLNERLWAIPLSLLIS